MTPCPRNIIPIRKLSVESIRIWQKYSQYRVLFIGVTEEEEKSYTHFKKRFFSPSSRWYEFTDHSGIMFIENIHKGSYAYAHIAFWDRDFKGKLDGIKKLIKFLMDIDTLRKLEVYIPDFCREALMFAKMVGFTEEGRLRKRIMYNNTMRSIVILGLCKEEI